MTTRKRTTTRPHVWDTPGPWYFCAACREYWRYLSDSARKYQRARPAQRKVLSRTCPSCPDLRF
jgi:hypothetical protein